MTAAPHHSTSIPSYLARHAEWIYRTLSLLGIAAVFVAVLWLNSKYVTRDEFNSRMIAVETSIIKIDTTLQIMQEQNKVNERQDATLRDIEQRIRTLERRPGPN